MTPLSKEQIEDVPLTAQQALARLRHQPGNLTKEQREFVALVIERLQSDLTATRNELEEERERCAGICEKYIEFCDRDNPAAHHKRGAAQTLASRIRALPSPQVKG